MELTALIHASVEALDGSDAVKQLVGICMRIRVSIRQRGKERKGKARPAMAKQAKQDRQADGYVFIIYGAFQLHEPNPDFRLQRAFRGSPTSCGTCPIRIPFRGTPPRTDLMLKHREMAQAVRRIFRRLSLAQGSKLLHS